MAGANSNILVTDLDFNSIKTNLKTFLQSQNKIEVLENGKVPDNNNGPKPYPTTELEEEGSDFTTVTSRRFKQMFNFKGVRS